MPKKLATVLTITNKPVERYHLKNTEVAGNKKATPILAHSIFERLRLFYMYRYDGS